MPAFLARLLAIYHINGDFRAASKMSACPGDAPGIPMVSYGYIYRLRKEMEDVLPKYICKAFIVWGETCYL